MRAWAKGDLIQNRWEILEDPKGGAFGTVYIVLDYRDTKSFGEEKIYAAKVLHQKYHSRKDLLDQFEREAYIWIRIGRQCPFIVPAIFVERINGIPLIFSEAIRNKLLPVTLREWLKKGTLSSKTVSFFAKQLSVGMQFANSKGINAHADLKPENFMITDDGILKITDWGFSQILSSETKAELSNPLKDFVRDSVRLDEPVLGGTFPYMSPELLRGEATPDISTDMWSFGVILFEMMTRRLPFPSLDRKSLIEAHENLQIPWPQHVDAGLCQLVSKCLVLDPSRRPTNFEVIGDYLNTVCKDLDKLNLSICAERPELATDLSTQAYSLLQLGREAEALELFQNAIPTKPGILFWEDKETGWHFVFDTDTLTKVKKKTTDEHATDDAWTLIGWIYHEVGMMEESITCFKRAINLNNQNVDALIGLAKCYQKEGRHEEAIYHYDKILTLPVTYYENTLFSSKLLAADRVSKAANTTSVMVTHRGIEDFDPTKLDFLSPEGIVFAIRYARSQSLMKTMRKDEGNQELQNLLMDIGFLDQFCYIVGLWDGKQYQRSSERLEFSLETLVAMGDISAKTGHQKDALTFFRRAVEIDSENCLAWYNVGTTEFALNNLERALEAFQKSVDIDKGFAQAWNSKGNLLMRLGRVKEAWDSFESAINADKNYAKPWLNKAGILMAINEFDTAIKQLERALEIDPEYIKAKEAMVVCLKEKMKRSR